MKEFIKLNKYGQLYIDKVLFESYFPIIFTCVNDDRDIFISVCCQNNEKGCKWLLGKTNAISIVRLLKDEITIRQLLLEYSLGQISVNYINNGYVVDYNNSDWDDNSPCLPKEDSYMFAEDGEFDDEIDYFSSLDDHNHVDYNAECYKSIAEILGTINIEIEPMAKALAVFASAIGSISIPSEVMVRTLRVFGKLCTNLAINKENYTEKEKYKSVYNSTFSVSLENLSINVESDGNNYADAA